MLGTRLGYRPALDGVRACAVLAVLLYHGDVSWLGGGFLGVDAFFVLSGFLITSLLFAESRARGRVDLKGFWVRRARRLLPALFLVLLAVAIYGATWAPRDTLDTLRADALSSLGYVANWRFVLADQSYFDQFAAPSPLRHLWSLAIEEQFYLLWPLLFVGMLRAGRGSRGVLLAGTLSLASLSFVAMLLLADQPGDPSRVYYGTDTRACSILIGALLALVLTGRRVPDTRVVRIGLEAAAIASAVTLAWLWAATPEDARWLYRGGLAGAGVLVAVVLASVSRERPGPLGRILSVAPLRWIGIVSYGLYLWHWPVYVALNEDRVGTSGASLLAVRLGCTFALASVSYYLVEQPIRSGAWRGWSVRIAAPLGAGALAVALVAVTAGAGAPLGGATADALSSPGTRVVVTGDGVVPMVTASLRRYEGELDVEGGVVHPCGLAPRIHSTMYPAASPTGECPAAAHRAWAADVLRHDPDLVVLLAGVDPFAMPVGDEVLFDPGEQTEQLARRVAQRELEALAHGRTHVVVVPTPVAFGPELDGIEKLRREAWIARWNETLRGAVASAPKASAVLEAEARVAEPMWVERWLAPELELRGATWDIPTGFSIRALLVGDSVGLTLAPGLERVADPRELFVLNRGVMNCGTMVGQIDTGVLLEPPESCTFEKAWAEEVARYRPQLVIGYWGWVDLWDRRIGPHSLRFGSPYADRLYAERLDLAVRTLTAQGAHLALVTSPVFDRSNATLHAEESRTPFSPARVEHWNSLLRAAAKRHPEQVTIIDLNAYQSPGGVYAEELDGTRVVEDGVHYTPEGADLVGRWLVPQLLEVARGASEGRGVVRAKQ